MALIHERLYLEKDISNILLGEYIEELINELSNSYAQNFKVVTEVTIAPIQISIDTAIPVGLILNEIITNSLKHAFSSKGGSIKISSQITADVILIKVSDSGNGFDFENYKGLTFGLELIHILVAQINGTITYSNKNSSCYTIEFPRDSSK